jgi:hypothetical protein
MELGHFKMHTRDPLGRDLGALIGRSTLCLNAVTGSGITR